MLDVKTGEVLAMVNQPTYNPNDRSQYSAERYRNRAITDIFEPGSSIKPLVVAAAARERRVTDPAASWTRRPASSWLARRRSRTARNLGRVSLTTILARSSNVGITKLAMTLQPDQLWQTMTDFGLGSLTTSGFPGRVGGPADTLQ